MPPKLNRTGRRIATALLAGLAISLASLGWSGCGGSSEKSTSSVQEEVSQGIEEAQHGIERGVEQAKESLKENPKAEKRLEEARKEAEKGIEQGKAEAEKGLEEARERLHETE